jgi:hypothetical protein
MTRSLIILAFGILKKYIHLSIQLNVYTNKWIWIFCKVNLASYINLLTHVTYGNKIQELFFLKVPKIRPNPSAGGTFKCPTLGPSVLR